MSPAEHTIDETKICPQGEGCMKSVPKARSRREGRCYELAMKFQWDNPGWVLVHATVRAPCGPVARVPIDHAFVESDGEVFDPVLAQFFPSSEYYRTYKVTDARRYDSATAAQTMLLEGHFGPWDAPVE